VNGPTKCWCGRASRRAISIACAGPPLSTTLSRPRAASTLLRMIIHRLLCAARLTTMRMQQPIPSASKLASGLAADPQRLGPKKEESN
jgi:hypothetical protein